MPDLGNLTEDQVVDFEFSSHAADGTPTTLLGTPALRVRKGNTAAPYGETPASITLSVDFNSITGLNHVRIDTSVDAFFAVGNDYNVAISAGTVDGVSVIGAVVATFSIENRYVEETKQTGDSFARLGAPAGASVSADIADVPTVTEFNARTLPAADYVVVTDTIAGATLVTTVTTLTNLPAATTDWLTAAAVKADAVTEIQSGLSTLTSQNVRDAMKLAPTAGDPAAGSIDKHADDIETDTDELLAMTQVV